MSKNLKNKMLALAAAAAIGISAAPAQSNDVVITYTYDDRGVVPYVIDNRKAVATSGTGLCWRTGFWSPAVIETAVAGQFPVGCSCDADIIPADKCAVVDQTGGGAKAAPQPTTEKIKLSADALFDFDSAMLRQEGKMALNDLAAKASNVNLEVILAVGHTDRIGSDSYNKALSERRATSVKNYLVSKGIDAKRIYTEGKGESQPVTGTACDNVNERSALISCLQPDRRVEVEVIGTK